MDISLYDYQVESVETLRANIRRGTVNQILAAPTGSGKTVIAAYLLDECYQKGKRAVFVADRVNLIDQTSAVLDHYGIPHGVVQADHWRRRPWERIQIASAQTLARRQWPSTDLIIVDEAHTMHKVVLRKVDGRQCVTIGLTATPFTKGLGRHYDAVVSVTTTNKLVAEGRLAPFRVFAASEPDMEGAKVVAGEWTEAEAARRAMPIIGDCVAEYLKHCAGTKFIAFGVNVAHCEEMQRQFMAAGVMCGLYTYKTSDAERQQMLRDFSEADSHLSGLISVAALAKGFDSPGVQCIIMSRPLRTSLAEHIQILGRGLRADPDNPSKECTVLDHAGNMLRFWEPMQEFFEHGAGQLDDGRKKEKKPKPNKERPPVKCPKCACVHARGPYCPACGYEYPRRSDVEILAGELRELVGEGVATGEERQALYSQLLYIATERSYKPGWAAWQYKARTGVWPSGLEDAPAPPTLAVQNWARSRLIAYRKARAKASV